MKKIALLLLSMLPLITFAQFKKGDVFLGGTLSTSLQNTDSRTSPFSASNATNNSFGISPSIGFFINSKIAIGASPIYNTSKQVQTFSASTTTGKSNSYGVGSFVRYYLPISNSIYFTLQGSVSFLRGTSETTQVNGTTVNTIIEQSQYTVSALAKPVFIFFPSPKWGIETGFGSLSYNYTRLLPDSGASTGFGLNAGTFTFGVSYYFIKK
ncbi:hypothetical protein WSM22_11310 [Cytophagales bacterium WSM2-2]|nr:hypothetical protein WSM22_11310 [Cytophagales bacterium WSM2-2]